MKKRKSVDPSTKKYDVTPNNKGFQIRLRPDFAVSRRSKVRQLIYEPDIHEPRPGDLIVRKIV